MLQLVVPVDHQATVDRDLPRQGLVALAVEDDVVGAGVEPQVLRPAVEVVDDADVLPVQVDLRVGRAQIEVQGPLLLPVVVVAVAVPVVAGAGAVAVVAPRPVVPVGERVADEDRAPEGRVVVAEAAVEAAMEAAAAAMVAVMTAAVAVVPAVAVVTAVAVVAAIVTDRDDFVAAATGGAAT